MTWGTAAPTTKADAKWPAPIDLVMTACLVVLSIFTAAVAEESKVSGEARPSEWFHWLLVVAPSVPVAFRRTSPLVATAASVIAQLVLWYSGIANAFIAPLVMIYTVCADAGDRGRKLGIASAFALSAMTLLGVFVAPDVTVDLLVFTSLAGAMAYLLGTNAAQQRETDVELAQQLAVTRVERDAVRDRAAATERQRIARELHDIVGHSLSVIAVRAEAADRVGAKNQQAARDAVAAIAVTARSSLAEVRRVLIGLREEDAEVELAPLPSLGSLPSLVASFAEAGLGVSIASEIPDDASVGAAVGAGAYRIVQEALTNVLKHGGPQATASAELRLASQTLTVTVDDDGWGAVASASESDGTDGNGLAGMRERAEVLGGELVAGPRAGGGYRVIATLPVDVVHHDAVAQGEPHGQR